MWGPTSVGIQFTVLQQDRAPFILSIYLPPFCFIVCKENVFCHIHELQISFSWTGRTDSSSSSSQQSIIPLLSHCLSFMFLPYLLLSPPFMGKAAWNTSWQLHSAVDFCILVYFSSTYKQNNFCWENINLGKKKPVFYLHGGIYRLKIRMCQYYLHSLNTVYCLNNLYYLKVFLTVFFFQSIIL